MGHEAFDQLLAGDLLRDLDAAEQVELDAHRASGCTVCPLVIADLDETAADLALAVPQRRPPPSLRSAVLGAIGAGASTIAAPGPALLGDSASRQIERAAPREASPARGRADGTAPGVAIELASVRGELRLTRALATVGLAVAAVVAAVAVGLGAQTVSLNRRLDDVAAAAGRATAALDSQGSAMAVALTPGHQAAHLESEPIAGSASANVIYLPGSDRSYLVASGLPPTPPGKVYQLWIADGSGVHALGTFAYDGRGLLVVAFGVDLAGKKAAMVTLEPADGAKGAPGEQVVFGEL